MYQFLHIETYSLHSKYNKKSPEKSSKSFHSVSRELMRHPDAIPHVSNPLPPSVLYGYDAYVALQLAQERVNASTDQLGRKIRKDAQVVLSGVISCPLEFKEDSDKIYKQWIADNIKYLQNKYGGELISVILHEDESHPHLHFICIPKQTDDCKLHIKSIHEPIRAREETSGGRKAKYEAYKKAFRELQDEYYYSVASKYGFLRDGARKQRLTRSEYMKRKESAKKLSVVHQDLSDKFEQHKKQKNHITLEKSNIEKERDSLQKQELEIIESKKDLVEITKITKEREADMLCLFKRRKSKSAEIELYKNEAKSLRSMLTRFKRKVLELKALVKDYKDKIHQQAFEIDCLRTRVKDLEREKAMGTYKTAIQKYSSSNTLTPRQEALGDTAKEDRVEQQEKAIKPKKAKSSSLDYEP
ncbi:plasmid recombination protein [Vibrio parahaemolyticus]|uniref:plasmid recombination protein n=1 Tax=Vibrio parahaemolyticus TaxID=670 RepID=UPI00226B94FF|nr:plasmid recombination protein [Vibrio parahaemolyticus]MCX8773448.1 plasmid recombination protein [Vibrio parahaemolyticus]